MKKIHEVLNSYHDYHTKPITKLTHFIGIPLIFISIMMALNTVHLAYAGLAALLVYYLSLDVSLAVVTTLFLLPLTFVSTLVTASVWTVAIVLFVAGWIFQLVGHYFEGNRPALLDNFSQLFTAPIFLVAELASFWRHSPL